METKNNYLWVYLTGFFLILVLPLLNLPPWFSPPDWGKTIIFKSIVAVLLFVFILQLLSKKSDNTYSTIVPYLLQRKSRVFWSFWLLVALLGIFFLATVFSLDVKFSFWGNPYRSGGFLNFASYIIFTLLAFLVLRKSDWQKIWTFSFIVAILVSLIAIFQQFKILSNIFVSVANQPWSTIGGSTFLAVYLLVLSFLVLSFAIKSFKNLDRKWFFYLPCLFLFIFVILLTVSRAAYLGLLIGLIYFILFYPKKIFKLKFIFGLFLIFIIFSVYYLNNPQYFLPQFIKENKIFQQIQPRLSISLFLNDPRFSAWRISARSIIENPILGYGPENFNIAFDKYYDPKLPKMMPSSEILVPISWYDRAHNLLLDVGVTAGIPALIIYLGVFTSIFWTLQKIKYKSDTLACHNVQAAFIAYLTANFFGFDVFSTYLVSFLLLAYSLSLIRDPGLGKFAETRVSDVSVVYKFKYPITIILFIGLCWFIWAYNIKPFQINTEINLALSASNRGESERALRRMENILPSDTFLNEYLRSNYVEIINNYILKEPTKAIRLIFRGIEIMESATEIRPTYTRYWLMLGNYYNILLKNYQNAYPELVDTWKNEANQIFEKLEELSPKRQEIFIGWSKVFFLTGNYQTAKEKIQKCLDLNPEYGACWWNLILINIKENNIEEAKKNIEIAKTKEYSIDNNEELLLELKTTYMSLENREQYLKEICELNYKLVKATDKEVYKLNLLACYLKMNDFEKAKALLEKITEEWIETKNNSQTRTSLLTLRGNILALENYQDYYEEICIINTALTTIDDSNPEYKMDLLDCLLKINDKEGAQKTANEIRLKWPEYTEEVNKLIQTYLF